MLKGIDRTITAELLHVLMLMGHGDQIVICRRQPSRRGHRQPNHLRSSYRARRLHAS